ncbi:MAG: hypothetical protein U0163_08030 [Gemmatimonadaceae bacterium]
MSLIEMALGDEDAWALGMTCGGTVELLLEPVDPSQASDPLSSALRVADAAVARGRRAWSLPRSAQIQTDWLSTT